MDAIVDGVLEDKSAGRVGDFMHTYNGVDFWPLDPLPHEILLEDIAHALSRICRFNGHTKWHYSVAQHAVIVSLLVPAAYALDALHHDDSEAYLSDLTRPVKKNIPQYKEIESGLEKAIAERFDLIYPWPEEVHDIDTRIVADEATALFKRVPPWTRAYRKVGARILPMPAFIARRMYIHRHRELTEIEYNETRYALFMRFVTRIVCRST